MNALRTLFAKMSPRERWLVLGLTGGVVASLVLVYFIVMWSAIGELEELIDDARTGFAALEQALPPYLAQKQRNETLLEQIKVNPVKSLRLPINAISKAIVAREGGDEGVSRRLSDIVRFSGKTRETPLFKAERKKKGKKGKSQAGDEQNLYWIEEEMDFPGVSADAMFEFLGKIHESEDLLFVNALTVTRKSNDPNEVRMSVTVGTIQYVEPNEEDL